MHSTSDIDTELTAALDRIHWRHAKVDDPRRSGLSDEPAQILEHLTRYSTMLPMWVRGHDALDGLILLNWLWWEDRRRERSLLRRGLAAGLTHRELGEPLGITTTQGVRDRLDRLDALLAHDRPDEKLTRAARHEAAQHATRARWIADHEADARTVIENLIREIARVPELAPLLTVPVTASEVGRGDEHAVLMADAAEWFSELRADLATPQLSPATIGVLNIAIAPLRSLLHDLGLDPGHGLWRALRAAEQLRSRDAAARGTT